jgi:hypothetical protein
MRRTAFAAFVSVALVPALQSQLFAADSRTGTSYCKCTCQAGGAVQPGWLTYEMPLAGCSALNNRPCEVGGNRSGDVFRFGRAVDCAPIGGDLRQQPRGGSQGTMPRRN